MFYPQQKRPLQNMQSQAAQLAAQKMDEDPNAPPKAPVIPTTNMRMPNTQPQIQRTAPQPNQQIMNAQSAPQQFIQQPRVNQAVQNIQQNAPRVQLPAPAPAQQTVRVSGRGNLPIQGYYPNPPTPGQGQVEGSADAEPGSPFAAPDNRTREQMFDDALRELMGKGPRDTSQEERLLREQMQRDVGAGQAALNARMAAGGGGTSGALGALTTDMNSRAALEAAKGIEMIKENARGEWLDRVKAGMGGFVDDRGISMDEKRNQMIMDIINRQMDEDQGAASTTGDNRTPEQIINDARTMNADEDQVRNYDYSRFREIYGRNIGDDGARQMFYDAYKKYRANGGKKSFKEYADTEINWLSGPTGAMYNLGGGWQPRTTKYWGE